MADVHHFTYGAYNPIAAYLLAFLGSFLGLLCTARARGVHNRGRRNRWLVIAAFAIGGGGIWLMHFSALLGFDVPVSPVRYDLPMTLFSLLFAVAAVAAGLMVAGHGKPGTPRIVTAGLLTGTGMIAMHYTGLAGIRLPATIHYSPVLATVSGLIAITAGTCTLRFAVSVRGWARVTGAAAVMAVAFCGTHYTGMAAMSIELTPGAPPVGGIRPITMLVPITLIVTATIVAVALSALQAMTEEEFTHGAGSPKRGMHAEPPQPRTVKHAPAGTVRLTSARTVAADRTPTGSRPSPGRRPSPRPSPSAAQAAPPATSGG